MNLIFCFDGTLNGRDDKIPTNIRRLHRGMQAPDQTSFYFSGPGNEDENDWLGEKLGGLFGWGSSDIRDDAMITLTAAYRPGDQIIVLGFSRGAAIARMFAAQIAREGVNGRCPHIHFLGCFDTVAAYLPLGPAQQGVWHDLHVHPKVLSVAHAVGLNETRKAFEPNLMNVRQGVTEVWFKGSHSDIGGGFKNTGLSDIPLGWMIKEMQKHTSVKVTMDLQPYPDSHVGEVDGIWRRGPRRVGVKVNDEWTQRAPLLFIQMGDNHVS